MMMMIIRPLGLVGNATRCLAWQGPSGWLWGGVRGRDSPLRSRWSKEARGTGWSLAGVSLSSRAVPSGTRPSGCLSPLGLVSVQR